MKTFNAIGIGWQSGVLSSGASESLALHCLRGCCWVAESHAPASHRSTVKLPKGDAALLRLAAAVKLIEADPVQAREYERRLEQDMQAFEEWQRT